MGLGIQKRRKEAGDGNRDIVKNREKLFGQIMRRYFVGFLKRQSRRALEDKPFIGKARLIVDLECLQLLLLTQGIFITGEYGMVVLLILLNLSMQILEDS